MATKLEIWEDALQRVLSFIDRRLEEKYGRLYPLHPARPATGTTGNPQYDGLFRVTAVFSAGIGSRLGKGYLFRVEIVTLSRVKPEVRAAVEEEAADMLRKGLKEVFPGRDLSVDRDNGVLKIYGDLSLD